MLGFFQLTLCLFAIILSVVVNLDTSAPLLMWLYILLAILQVIQEKKISLVTVFLCSFIYMVFPEAILFGNLVAAKWGIEHTQTGFLFLIVSSICVFVGYKTIKKSNTPVNFGRFTTTFRKKRLLFAGLITFSVVFFLINLNNTITGLTEGRASAFPFFYSNLLYSLAFACVGLFDVYFNHNKLKVLLASSLIIITFIGTGTRFFLLFIAFIVFFDSLQYLNKRKAFSIFIATVLLVSTSEFIKSTRAGGLLQEAHNRTQTFTGISNYIASKGSAEGLLSNSAMILKYTSEHSLTYGKSIGFLLYFWIPRGLWEDKPTMLDHWLIRQFDNTVSEGFSTASGYGGELLIDFGFLIASLILFFMGRKLAKMEVWIRINSPAAVDARIFSGFLYGFVFFATRSLLTSIFMLISTYFVFKVLFYYLFKKKILQRSIV